MSAPDDFPPQAYLTRIEAAKRWLATPSLDRSPRQKYVRADLCTTDERVRALEAENARLRGALKPFASAWDIASASGDTAMSRLAPIARSETAGVHFMRARAALRDMDGGKP